jgi:drug/metabolite transporter (DMT)-like permease
MSASTDSRRLARAWMVLAGLTVISVGAAVAGGADNGSSLVAVLVALAASFIKARQVLDHFLDLRRAGRGWQTFFTALLALLLGCCLVLYAIAARHSG